MMHRPGSDTVQWRKTNTEEGKEELGQGIAGKQENAWKARCTTQRKSAMLKYELWQESHETSSASSATSNLCLMGLQLGHWIRILPQSTTLPFRQKLLSTFHLRGNHRGVRMRAPLGLGELVGQGKGISLTMVPHGPPATDSRIHGVGRWNNWEVSLSKFYSSFLLSSLLVAFSLPSRGWFVPWLLNYTQLEVSHLKWSCCSSKCVWQSNVGIRTVVHQTKGGHIHLN